MESPSDSTHQPPSICNPPAEDHQNPEHSEQDSPNPGKRLHLFRHLSFSKRKKTKSNLKKLQAIQRKCITLIEQLTPVPFSPAKILYFAKYEHLLRKLGLWDFVNVEFDGGFRVDLIAQLVASYDAKARCSYVNGVRILVNRSDLGRAFGLPVKKERVSAVGEGGEVCLEFSSEESIGFVEDFVLNWLLLHDDGWIMPGEVLNWMKVIKEGHLEKVDWAGLFWFMVEKELTRGEQLVDCYYASHLQHLIMYQSREVVLAGGPDKVDFDGKEKEEVGGANEGCLQVDCTNEVQKEEVDVRVESELVDLAGKERKGEVGEGNSGVDSMTDVQKGEVDVRVEFVELAGEEGKGEVGDRSLGVDSVTDVHKEEFNVGVESELVDLAREEGKEEVGEGSLVIDSITDVHQEEVDVGVEPESVDLAAEDGKGEVGEGSLGVESIPTVQKEEVDVGVESELVDLAGDDDKGEVGEGSLRVDLLTDVQKEEVDVGVEFELVHIAREERKEEVGEQSLGVDSINDVQKEEVDVPARLNIELSLGKDTGAEKEIVEEEKVLDAEMLDLEEGDDLVGDDKLVQWQLDAENTINDHTLQRCNMGHGNVSFNYEGIEEEVEDIEEDEEAEDPFETLVGDGLTGNFLQAMQANKLAYSSHEQFNSQHGHVASMNDMHHIGPSFFNSGSKRVIEHMSENSPNGNGKRLRIDGPWNNESPNFVMCMDGMQQFITRARMMYEAKEHSLEQSNMNEQILLGEVHKRDGIIEHLKIKCEEMQAKDEEVYRLDREVQVMGNLLNGYREALKGTQKAFAEYKKQNPLPEESIYKDAGPGGLMLTTEAIDSRRLKQKEVDRTNCLMLEQKAKEAEEVYARQFEALFEKVCKLDSRLVGLENKMIELRNSSRNHKGSETEHPISSKTSLPNGCEGIENQQLDEPVNSMNDMLDNGEGTENEHPVSRETCTPGDQQGAETEQK